MRQPNRLSEKRLRSTKHSKTWELLPDRELLERTFSSLDLQFGRFLERCLDQLKEELETKELRFRPHVWLSDEFFCPDGVPGFAVPFYLAHPRLVTLERHQMLEVEGGSERTCLKILRHETGHALDNAYRLRRHSKRRKVFGDPKIEYPEVYTPQPFSRRFVKNIRWSYAQSHPDEDFAETFAVWLDPSSNWRHRYAGWPAFEKLTYVNELLNKIRSAPQVLRVRSQPGRLAKMNESLGEHYRKMRERFQVDFAKQHDDDLTTLFSVGKTRGVRAADTFLRSNASVLRQRVARWTGIHQYTVDQVLKDWISRARAQKLVRKKGERETMLEVVAALTTRTIQYVQGGHHRLSL